MTKAYKLTPRPVVAMQFPKPKYQGDPVVNLAAAQEVADWALKMGAEDIDEISEDILAVRYRNARTLVYPGQWIVFDEFLDKFTMLQNVLVEKNYTKVEL